MLPVTEEKVCPPEDVEAPANTKTHGIGIGFDRYPYLQTLSASLVGIHADLWPKASSVIQLARLWLSENEPLGAEQAQPVYLRDNVAKKEKDR